MNKNNYFVYLHKNLTNNKVYIGITKRKPEERQRYGQGYIKNEAFYQDILIYGQNNFEHKILFSNLSEQEAYLKEIELIAEYNATNPDKGYNKSKGGATGPGDFTKMIEQQRSHKKFGEDNIHSKKVKCIETGDVFASISEAQKQCDSTKVGACCRGERAHAGHHPLTKELLSQRFADKEDEITIHCPELIKNEYKNFSGKAKKVLCIETNEIFNSETEACKAYNCAIGTISRVCLGKRKTALKKHQKYINEGEEI